MGGEKIECFSGKSEGRTVSFQSDVVIIGKGGEKDRIERERRETLFLPLHSVPVLGGVTEALSDGDDCDCD